jgi:prepilin signal peptidase PulO-like enzyme (type II secretory pathway)
MLMVFELIVTLGFGLMAGSFVTAAVWRLRQQETGVGSRKSGKRKKLPDSSLQTADYSIVRGRSMCPHCKHQLSPLDLVPLVSWLALRGRCRYCNKQISAEYPLTEALTGLLFGLSILALDPATTMDWLHFMIWLLTLTGLIVLTIYDLKWMILPDRVILPVGALAAADILIYILTGEPLRVWSGPLVAAAVSALGFYLLAMAGGGRWMGGGDVKLVFVLGLILGIKKTTLAMVLAFNVAAIVGLSLMAVKLKSRRDLIAFGPYLIGATVVAKLYGSKIIDGYLSLIGVL